MSISGAPEEEGPEILKSIWKFWSIHRTYTKMSYLRVII